MNLSEKNSPIWGAHTFQSGFYGVLEKIERIYGETGVE
jgi:hypothetical protein